MAKGKREQSRQSSAIHLVHENGTLPILKSDLTPAGARELLQQSSREMSPMAIRRLNEASRSSESNRRATLILVNPATVLRELFELLEDYAPVWYTEDNHNRAVAALSQIMR